jgi:hypothetical protein
LKNLVQGKVKEDVWTLNGDSIINVRYNIFEDKPNEKKIGINNKKINILPGKDDPPVIKIVSDKKEKSLKKQVKIDNETKTKSTFKPISIEDDNNSRSTMKSTEDDNISVIKPIKLNSPKKNSKKLAFNVPENFKGRELVKKMATSKVIIQMDNLRKIVLGKKESNKSIELKQKTSNTNISAVQLTKLEYETKDMDDADLGFLESFADYFFICGVPKKNCKKIPDSEDLEPCCKHSDCGLLNSYRPDIIHRYPEVNNKVFNLCNSVIIVNIDC